MILKAVKARAVGQCSFVLSVPKAPAVDISTSRSSSKVRYKVTLETPTGKKTLQVEEDVYIVDAAEVRSRHCRPSISLRRPDEFCIMLFYCPCLIFVVGITRCVRVDANYEPRARLTWAMTTNDKDIRYFWLAGEVGMLLPPVLPGARRLA